jgi:hypothetical protein
MFVLTPARLVHITVGDRTGGGHMHGAAGNGTKFPPGWDAAQISRAILDVAPRINNWILQPNGNRRGSAVHAASGLTITVILHRDHDLGGNDRVWTAWP